jgi:ubiquinone/menaquinone biosynthesis C-methylase UbiE
MENFDRFCSDKNYVLMKNSLFNYLNRKKEIKSIYKKININKKSNMIDIGSGLSPVTPKPNKTLFIDISKEALLYLKGEGYKTKYGNITKIPLKADSVNLVFCSEVLEHVKNYKRGLEEIHRILSKNGLLILTVPVHQNYWSFDDEFVNHLRRFEPRELRKELKEIGFKIIKEKPIGSRLERELTKLTVRLFKKQKNLEINKLKVFLSKIVNGVLYLALRFSLLTTSKKSTSVMLYLCEKY